MRIIKRNHKAATPHFIVIAKAGIGIVLGDSCHVNARNSMRPQKLGQAQVRSPRLLLTSSAQLAIKVHCPKEEEKTQV